MAAQIDDWPSWRRELSRRLEALKQQGPPGKGGPEHQPKRKEAYHMDEQKITFTVSICAEGFELEVGSRVYVFKRLSEVMARVRTAAETLMMQADAPKAAEGGAK